VPVDRATVDRAADAADAAAAGAAVERARAYFEQFAAEYDDAARESGWRLNGLLAQALAGVGPALRAVDLACGTGETLDELARALPGAELVGVDLAAAMVDRSAERVPRATVVQADLRDFLADTPDGWFDVVTVVGGFEFTPDLPGLLHQVRRVVAPDGHLVFTYEPVLNGWPPQSRRVETNLGSNGLELTTFRWEPGEVASGFAGWETVRSTLLAAYQRDNVPTVYAWLQYRRPAGRVAPAPATSSGAGVNSPGSS